MSKASSQAIASKVSLILLPVLSIATSATSAIAQVISAEDRAQTTVDIEDNYINITGGQNSGNNLFHSFEQFNITAEETANFVTDNSVQNVVGRINGSQASIINGTLQVEGSEASLYLMNPAGILFGPETQLNLPGSFTASTATSMGFNDGRFSAERLNDYSSLTGDPNAFYFETERPGAVVNLGNLSVEEGRSISLIGGTVVNDGSLSAPEGTLSIAAAEGGKVVRLSQNNQLLSLEVEASDTSFDESLTITAQNIGQMLTGGDFAEATSLSVEEGRVRLGNAAIDEGKGNALISQRFSDEGQINSYDGRAVTISATHDIAIMNSTSEELSFTSGASLAFVADADKSGEGQFLMDISSPTGSETGGTINTDGGTIFISGAGITAGRINTDLTTQNETSGGNVTLVSSRGVSADSISTNSFSFPLAHSAGSGGDVTVKAEDGDIVINNLIKTWAWAVGENAVKGGDITLEASGSIQVAGTLNSGTIASVRDKAAKPGGAIALLAQTGNISVGAIDTRSLDYNGDGEAEGGSVTLLAQQGLVEVAAINSSPLANVGASAAKNGGTVTVEAQDIDINRINLRVNDTSNYYGSGDVSLRASRDLSVQEVIAIGSKTEPVGGNIQLFGDSLALTGGRNSVVGNTVHIAAASEAQDIRIGTDSDESSDTSKLDISASELNAISDQVNQLTIGAAGSTGAISILSGAIRNITRPRITLAGGRSLLGPNQDTRYELTGAGEGYLLNSAIEFSSISSILGGSFDDTFSFAEDASVNQFERIDGGAGNNSIRYESMREQPTDIDLGSTALTNIGQLFSTGTEGTLRGEQRNNTWIIDGPDSGYINGLRFEGFKNLVGGNQEDILRGTDDTDIFEITGDRAGRINDFTFLDIEVLDGRKGTDTLTLATLQSEDSNQNHTWNINRGGVNTVESFRFQNFETLVGSVGKDTFDVSRFNSASDITIVGGSNEGNRIVTDSLNTTWAIGDLNAALGGVVSDGKNKGALLQDGTSLLTFSDIQNIQNDSLESEGHTVQFINYLSQITESIDSGTSDLRLIGDDINIGQDSNGSNVGGKIVGQGRLSIRPNDSAFDIELGGQDGSTLALNITEGELAAIQPGFAEIEIGSREQVGGIRLVGDAAFKDGVVLRSQSEIDTRNHLLTTINGNITLQTDGRIRSGPVTAINGGVRLQARQDIQTGAIAARGQGITLLSEGGSVIVNGDLDSSGELRGGDIEIAARTDIKSDRINTSGGRRSGNITIRSATGRITTGGITTANGDRDDGGSPRQSGSVSLNSEGTISIEFIDARGNNNSEPTQVDISTEGKFKATGSIENSDRGLLVGGASISTIGTKDGKIRISYGSVDRAGDLFQVGNNNVDNGTAFRIEAPPQTAILSGNFLGSYKQDQIELFNRGRLPAGISDAAANRATVTTSELLNVRPATSNSEDTRSLFQQIETRNNQNFEDYLGIVGTAKASQSISLQETQDALKEIERSTTAKPAIVYVYFVPDAASEASVILEDRDIQPDDQLEIMVIAPDGEPVRQRRWGITRAQVDQANRTLRRQATSQFSTPQQYLPPAQQLYDWIVDPISEILSAQQITSLGFVMDTGLRTMPVSALHDGDRYLVESYSLGLLPSVSLANINNTERTRLKDSRILAMGASKFENQPDLPAVNAEVSLIEKNRWEGDAFLNEDFVLTTLQNQLQKEDYGIVHLATHAVFESGDLENSYIQLWDEKLSLGNINALQLDQEKLSMIILSACNTAVGDLEAEYGFAGFAVSAGSQSALASLWPVSDEGTLGFMTQFYDQMRDASVKTDALQQAQVKLINGEVGINDGEVYGSNGEVLAVLKELKESGRWDFSHPFYWSAFTMIGNPW